MRISGPKSNVYDIWLKSVKISPTNFLYERTEKEIMQGTMPGARRRGRPRTAWMDNIKAWTGLSVEESIRMTEINGESTSMVWPTLGATTAKEQNRAVGP